MDKIQRSQEFIDKLLSQTISLIVTFLFSIGLVGGSSYILFDLQKELLELEEYLLVFETIQDEVELSCAICEITNNGWLSPENAERTFSITETILTNKHEPKLEREFASDSLRWCEKSILQISREEGRVSGFVFDNDLSKKHQEIVLKQYGLYEEILIEFINTIENWEVKFESDRDLHLEVIHANIKELLAAFESYFSLNEQIIKDYETKKQELDHEYDEFKMQYWKISNRYYLSIVGIILGLIIFIIVLVYSIKRYKRDISTKEPEETEEQEKNNC